MVIRLRIAVVGAGPSGSLVAGLLAQQNHEIVLIDRRPRKLTSNLDGRTIQLSLSPRGRKALRKAGLISEINKLSIELIGRVLHTKTGDLMVQEIEQAEKRNHSINRDELTETILKWALQQQNIEARFETTCIEAVYSTKTLILQDKEHNMSSEVFDLVIGADGTASEVRTCLVRPPWVDFLKYSSPWGYAELAISSKNGNHIWNDHAIHIWPRKHFFVVGFPALDGTYKGTLVARHIDWPNPKKSSYEFEFSQRSMLEDLQDLWPHLVDEHPDILSQPLKRIPIVRCSQVDDGEWIVLIGDAAHATAPFMGQGVNIALEDAVYLAEMFSEHSGDLKIAISEYGKERAAEGLACCDLSDRAAKLLLRMPKEGDDAAAKTLSHLNIDGYSYQDVAKDAIEHWTCQVIPAVNNVGRINQDEV